MKDKTTKVIIRINLGRTIKLLPEKNYIGEEFSNIIITDSNDGYCTAVFCNRYNRILSMCCPVNNIDSFCRYLMRSEV